MQDPNSELKKLKEHLLYTNNWVFKFSTSDETLYPVLDQIVQSFEYIPSAEDIPSDGKYPLN